MPFSRGSSQLRDRAQVSCTAGGFLTSWATGEAQDTGVGSCSLLQGIFPTQGSNPGLLHCRWILDQLSYQGSPLWCKVSFYYSFINSSVLSCKEESLFIQTVSYAHHSLLFKSVVCILSCQQDYKPHSRQGPPLCSFVLVIPMLAVQ